MKTDRVEGNRKQDRSKVVEPKSERAHEDSDAIQGKSEPRATNLQAAYGISREKDPKDADGFCKSN